MARQPDVPRSLRRAAAARAGPRGKAPSPRLVDAAAAGVLTRGNTDPGTAGRKAVDRVQYRRRAEVGRWAGLTPREAAGHDRPEVREARAMSAMVEGRRQPFTILEGLTRREASRLGRYDNLVGQLAAGVLDPKAFRRRVSSWAPVQGQHLVSDPDVVLAVLEGRRAAEEPLFIYASGRSA